MSDLIAVAYPDQNRAAEVLGTLRRVQVEQMLNLEDACYVTEDRGDKVQLHPALNLATAGVVGGALWVGLSACCC